MYIHVHVYRVNLFLAFMSMLSLFSLLSGFDAYHNSNLIILILLQIRVMLFDINIGWLSVQY